ncbi:hypothetical protein [Wolbachia endosymbiont of Ctenocephalides felis wCfeJ]|uniref:hypothetical protein n=1 Tax=Wolbachia endosymbiont of Ctenocephalides felis wCfeJ TaxID=2732594 RepID=UPI0014474487|nr:hypothetical protein [Wolbachia endosymbiont of Ctenocephalides felis wCfeJ]WCR58511.1 MAG: hypothetical protein PG980_000983 [Wolbachia endosymbiont of Ctenocephalides felis wCfeJ]
MHDKDVESIRKLFNLYNNKQTVTHRLWNVFKCLVTINFGGALKECFVRNTVPIEEKNILLAQGLKEIVNSNDNDGRVPNYVDEFLEQKLKEKLGGYFQSFNATQNNLELEKATEFSEFQSVAEKLLEGHDDEEKEHIIEKAKTLEDIAYPLTEKYFLFRYLAKAIVCAKDSSLSAQNNYQEEKSRCLIFSRELKNFTGPSNIQDASKKFSSEHRYIDKLLQISDKVSKHSGKIAATYVAYIAAITCARYAKDDEHNEAWYKLVALPSTILAMLQIVVSCPQIIFSAKKARDIRNYVFEGKKANGAYNITTSRVADVQLLDKNIPTFSNGMVYVCAGMFRWIGNLLLQPIDLVQDDTKDLILRWSAMRWFTPTGIVEEQSKVASFVNCELRNFVYDRILTGDSAINNQHVNRIFYLLYKRIEENKKCDLKRIYETLTGTEIANFESIVSNKEKRQISKLQIWERATYFFASSTLIAEYMCFNYRKQDIGWYEDPVFYFATIVKFMRLGSLLASKYFGNKITEYLTGNKLDNNKYFQDFFYNDTARMAAAVIPLIMFESTGDVKILSIATAIDVLTTVRSDISSGKALSKLNQVSIEKLTAELDEVSNCVRL